MYRTSSTQLLQPFLFRVCSLIIMAEGFEGDDPPRLPGLERKNFLIPVNQQNLRADRAKFQNVLMEKIVDAEVFTEGVQRYVAKYWSLLGDVSVQKINSLFLFHFTTPRQAKLLLENSPWNIKGCLFVLKSWQDHTIFSHVTFFTVDLWVRMVNIPSDCYYQELGLKIGTVLGPILDLDLSERRCKYKDYFRIKVRINLDEPLFPGVFIPLTFQREERLMNCEVKWLACMYERICHA
ncbi:hypothetical protein RJ639_003285 [Escallonia herrerae]|uniref:DUF4283 domain-containing protein n=1 Tax=Escallonia herrerae TaxID=1293975 RepID=A0AA88W579_9ASTE|nr:hypothetical protein RJ639_003285 [Escallonia herrerae]